MKGSQSNKNDVLGLQMLKPLLNNIQYWHHAVYYCYITQYQYSTPTDGEPNFIPGF